MKIQNLPVKKLKHIRCVFCECHPTLDQTLPSFNAASWLFIRETDNEYITECNYCGHIMRFNKLKFPFIQWIEEPTDDRT